MFYFAYNKCVLVYNNCDQCIGSSFEASANEDLACAVCASRIIPAGGSGQVEFCLAWDMPVIQFAHGVRKYYR